MGWVQQLRDYLQNFAFYTTNIKLLQEIEPQLRFTIIHLKYFIYCL